MKNQDIIDFTNANPICYLATADGNQPRVRAMGFWFADETGFYFQTGSIKKLVTELQTNPKAEACFYNNSNGGRMLRIEGEMEFLEDHELKAKAIKDRPFLLQFGLTAESPELIIFRLAHGKAHFWTMADNRGPKNYIEF